MTSTSDRRVVITGIGVIAPGGMGTKAFWELLTAGRTATRTITFFDPTAVPLAGRRRGRLRPGARRA